MLQSAERLAVDSSKNVSGLDLLQRLVAERFDFAGQVVDQSLARGGWLELRVLPGARRKARGDARRSDRLLVPMLFLTQSTTHVVSNGLLVRDRTV